MNVSRRTVRVSAVTITSVVLVVAFATASAQASTIRLPSASEAAVRFLEKRWGSIEAPDADVSDVYEDSAAGASQAASDKNTMLARYVLPVSVDGIKIRNAKVYPRDLSERVAGRSATVTGIVDVEFENHQPGVAEPIVTREANIPFTVQLRQQARSWRVWAASFADTWANVPDGLGEVTPIDFRQRPQLTRLASAVAPMGFYTYYNRASAAAYADAWWNARNPAYRSFSNDCANFVSQSFRAGSAPMAWASPYLWWYDNKGTSSSSDDTWHYAWAVAHDHSAIVVKVVNGVPYVNYHTTDAYQRHWNLGARSTKFLHAADAFFHN